MAWQWWKDRPYPCRPPCRRAKLPRPSACHGWVVGSARPSGRRSAGRRESLLGACKEQNRLNLECNLCRQSSLKHAQVKAAHVFWSTTENPTGHITLGRTKVYKSSVLPPCCGYQCSITTATLLWTSVQQHHRHPAVDVSAQHHNRHPAVDVSAAASPPPPCCGRQCSTTTGTLLWWQQKLVVDPSSSSIAALRECDAITMQHAPRAAASAHSTRPTALAGSSEYSVTTSCSKGTPCSSSCSHHVSHVRALAGLCQAWFC